MNNSRQVVRLVTAVLLGLLPAVSLAWKSVEAGKPYVHKPSGYSVMFPDDWKYSRLWFSDESGATRDGPNLQSIYVDFRPAKNAFRALKKGSTESMLPQEAAQLLVADMTKERSWDNVQVLGNEPTEVAGRPGFRLQLEYKNPIERGAVRYREIICAVVLANGIYLIGYRAPVLFYFNRDVGQFEATLASFKIEPPPPRK
jgi:hypothetical protein